MNEKRKKKPEKFTDMLRPWILARTTDDNVVIGREVMEGIRDRGRTKRCFVIEGLPRQGAVGNS
jgi:ribosomal protein L31E